MYHQDVFETHHAEELLASLAPGATMQQLAEAEAAFGSPLPDALKAMYMCVMDFVLIRAVACTHVIGHCPARHAWRILCWMQAHAHVILVFQMMEARG